MNSGNSERRRHEPKSWLRFEDVVHCRDIESLNAFIGQYPSERGLTGEIKTKCYWALFHAWQNGNRSG